MEVDDFAIQKLCNLKLKVLRGEVTDWPGERYHHVSSMTCSVLIHYRAYLPTWQWQLEQLLHKFHIVFE